MQFPHTFFLVDPFVCTESPYVTKSKEHLTDDEVAMAEQLINRMTDHFDPEKYHDTYRQSLLAVIEKNAMVRRSA